MRRLVILLPGLLIPALILTAAPQELTLRGRIQCLDEARNPAACTSDSRDFAFLAEEGTRYFLMREDDRTRMFHDERMRQRQLEVKAWLRDGGQIELIRVFTVHDGRLHDPHYYCSVCAIRTYAGGPCWCCQEEFEFREPALP